MGRLVNALFVCLLALRTLRWGVGSLSLAPFLYFRLGFEELGLGVGLKFVCFTFSERGLPFLPSFLILLLVFSRSLASRNTSTQRTANLANTPLTRAHQK